MKDLKWLLIALMFLLFLVVLVVLTKLTVLLTYFHHNDDDDLKIEFRIWFGLIKYTVNIPLIKVDDNSPSIILKGKTDNAQQETTRDTKVNQITLHDMLNSLKNYKEVIKHVVHFNKIVKRFLEKVSVKQFAWNSVIGVGDAAHTGMMAGTLWTIKGSVVGMLSHYVKIKKMPYIMVDPDFQQTIVRTKLSCMIQFRIGYAILAGLKLVKFWKGGRPHLKKNAMMSNEKTNSV